MTNRSSAPRVLHVIESSLGGARRYVVDAFEALGAGSQFGLAYSLHRADSGFLALLDRMRAAGWALFEIDMRRAIDPRRDLASLIALRNVYREFRPDVVHAHCSKAGALSRLATLALRQPPATVYTPNAIAVNLGWIYGPIERLLGQRLDILAAVTNSERAELEALHLVPPSRIHVVAPTIRADEFAPASRTAARTALGLEHDRPLVIAIGRLAAQKDPLGFADVVAAIRERVPRVRAIWVGDGELRAALDERIAQLGLGETLTVSGWLDDVRPHIAAADLFVSTARYESFGYVTAEALAMERPVVASRITGTVDIVTTDVADQLYPLGDVTAAATLAERLLTDPTRAAAIAGRGREAVMTAFSRDIMRAGLRSAYAAAMLA